MAGRARTRGRTSSGTSHRSDTAADVANELDGVLDAEALGMTSEATGNYQTPEPPATSPHPNADLPANPFGLDYVDTEAEEAMVAALSGRGPKVVDLTPAPTPVPPPSTLSEMWGRFQAFEQEVRAMFKAGGGPQARPGEKYPRPFRCAECNRVQDFMWPWPDGLEMQCANCMAGTLLIPLSPEEQAQREMKQREESEQVAV